MKETVRLCLGKFSDKELDMLRSRMPSELIAERTGRSLSAVRTKRSFMKHEGEKMEPIIKDIEAYLTYEKAAIRREKHLLAKRAQERAEQIDKEMKDRRKESLKREAELAKLSSVGTVPLGDYGAIHAAVKEELFQDSQLGEPKNDDKIFKVGGVTVVISSQVKRIDILSTGLTVEF